MAETQMVHGRRARLVCGALVLALASSVASAREGPGAPEPPNDNRLIETVPEGLELSPESEPVFAPTGDRAAYSVRRDGGEAVVVDGKVGDTFTWAHAPVFSRDGKSVAYRAGSSSRRGETWWVVHDGKKGRKYDWVGEPVLTPDGDPVYWAAKGVRVGDTGMYGGGEYFVVVGKKRGDEYDEGGTQSRPVLSADGETVAYVVNKGRLWHAVIDGEESDGFSMVRSVALSPDGRRSAFVALTGMGWSLVEDGEVGTEFQSVVHPALAGRRTVFGARIEGKWHLVDGGKVGKSGWVAIGDVVLSEDGKHLAALVNEGGEEPEGLPGMPHGFGPGGSVGTQVRGGSWRVVHDGEEGPEFEVVRFLTLSPDGEHVAYAARREDRWHLVVDDYVHEPGHDYVGRPHFDLGNVRVGTRDGRELWWRRREYALR